MTNSPAEPGNRPPARLDPSLIDFAPIEPDNVPAVAEAGREIDFQEIAAILAERLAEAEAENERLKGELTIDQVKAQMLAPYASKVFWFVVAYCAAVAGILLLSGWGASNGFHLSDTILGIIAGSTLVSVIGLIGMVISGLFGTPKKK